MQPPRLASGTVERSRLLDQLSVARHKTCVVIQGPAGSGKTTLALQWRMELLPFGFDFAWWTMPAGDDVDGLLEGLFSSLDQLDPKISNEAAFIYNRDGEVSAPDVVAIPLLNGLVGYNRQLVVLIDDYHNVTDPRGHQLIQTLLDFAPPHLHIVLVSRHLPPLALSRLAEDARLLEIDFTDLRFTFAEAERLLQAQYPQLTRRDARLLYDQTDGWGAGLRLVSMDLRVQKPSPGRKPPLQNAHDFAAYFNREVLAQLSPAEIDAMARLSVTQRFNDGLCAALFGAEASLALMNRLRRDNLFLIPVEVGSREGWYRFHPLFRDVMRERFEQMPQPLRCDTHALLGDWFGRRKHLFEAVRHCVAAGEPSQAADWVERHARELFLAGDMRRLVRAVAGLPEAVLAARTPLRLWMAWSQLCHRQLAECHQTIETLKASVAPDDEDAHHHLVLLEGSLAIQEEDTATGQRLVDDLERLPNSQDAILAGGRRNILGWLHIHLGHFPAAREILTSPVPFLEVGAPLLDSAFGSLLSQCMLGFSYFREGDMRESERMLHHTLATADRTLGIFSEAACNAASFLSAVFYETNRLEGLRGLLEPRIDAIERVALPEALICAAVTRIRYFHLEDGHLEALSELDRLEEQYRRRGLQRVRAYVLAERFRLFVRLDRIDAAEECVLQLKAMVEPVGGQVSRPMIKPMSSQPPTSASEIRALALWTEARWQASRDEPRQALQTLRTLESANIFPSQARKRVQLDAFTAVLLDSTGQARESRQRLLRLLELSRQAGLVRSVLDVGGARLLELADMAQQAGELTPTSAFYLEHLKLQASFIRRRPATRANASQETLSLRELDILKSLALTMSNKRVALALGVSPETVKWHLKNIYGKLGVYSRDDAVSKARNLGWLAASTFGSVL